MKASYVDLFKSFFKRSLSFEKVLQTSPIPAKHFQIKRRYRFFPRATVGNYRIKGPKESHFLRLLMIPYSSNTKGWYRIMIKLEIIILLIFKGSINALCWVKLHQIPEL